jgi:hypothetical protein
VSKVKFQVLKSRTPTSKIQSKLTKLEKKFQKGAIKRVDYDERLRLKRLLTSRCYRKNQASDKFLLYKIY